MAINRARHGRTKFVPPPVDQPPSEAEIDIFLKTYEETFSEYDARRKARISRAGLAKLKADPAFVARMEDAYNQDDYRVRLRAAARHQAIVHGSKDLLLAELRAEFPEIYNAKSSIDVKIDVKKASDEELEAIVQGKGKP